MCGTRSLRYFICNPAISLIAGMLISGAFGCTSVKPPNFGTGNDAASGGSDGAGLRSDVGGGANGDVGRLSDGKIAPDGARDGASPVDSPVSGGSDGSVGSGGTTGIGGSTGTGGSTAIGGSTDTGGSTAIGGSTGTGGSISSGGSTGTGGSISSGGSTGTGGSISSGGSTVSGGPDAALDAPVIPPDGSSPLPIGSACSASAACALGNCVDGVCCEIACSGCNACTQTLTGKKDGTCAPVISGQDPHNNCADETATKQCGNDGTCDGAGACRKVSTSHICTPASCSADNKTFTPLTTCDGAGACTVATPQSCGAFQCATSGCLKACSAQTDCGAGNYCNIPAGATAGTCAATKANGLAATQTFECTSGVVADGVCCNQACTGCSACTKALNGQTDGQCLSVPNGQVAHSACPASGTTCGLDGYCDGANKCRFPAAGTSCGTSCLGSTLTTKTCDGAGVCNSANSTCGGGLVCGATTCKTTCASDIDCVTGDYCSSGGTCATKLANGAACSTSNQCPAGNTCVENVCCSSACGIACKSCKTAGATGTCSFVAPGTSCGPASVCSAAGSCGACNQNATCPPPNQPCKTGTLDCSTGVPVCNATGNYPASQSCGLAASCNSSTNKATPAQMCDGNGNCPNVTPVNCSYGCSGTICAPPKTNGTSCSAGSECASGKCIDGVCCTASGSSCPTCQACNLNGSGTCSNKASGAADSACPASTANCLAGGCNGAGVCAPLSAGTSCGSGVCTNGPEDPFTLGQYTAPTYQPRLCDGGSGASHCLLGGDQGCGNLTCASATSCRSGCTRDADCVASHGGGTYYCAGITCALRKTFGAPCTTHNQCLSRVCLQGSCAECTSDDDCPSTSPSCCPSGSGGTGLCNSAGVCDDYASNPDGSVWCSNAGVCGSRHSVCTGNYCGCGSVVDCPIGTLCNPSNKKCLVNGGQPCVQSSDCLSNNCGTNGLCTLSPPGTICAADSYGSGRPTGCSSASANCDDQATTILNSICY